MTKPEAVTQEDNEAANSILYCVMENSFDTEGRFKLDMEKVAQAFARHRLAERAKIVAWLRGMGLRNINYIADAIEAGEHEPFTHPDNV